MVQPIFRPQHEQPADVGGDFWVRAIPLAGDGPMSSVFSTVHLGKDRVTVIDPGWIDEEDPTAGDRYLDDFEAFLRRHGRGLDEVGEVVVTHAHPDHIGATATLLGATNASYSISATEQATIDAARGGTGVDDYEVTPENTGAPDGILEPSLEKLSAPVRLGYIPDREPDTLLEHGDTVLGLDVVLTPGHTPGHLTLIDNEAKIAIVGDHVLPDINTGAGLGIASLEGNPVADYLGSLRAFSLYDDYLTVPGHGSVFTGLGERRRYAEEHLLVRAREVSTVLEREPGISVWDLASQLTWTLGWEGMKESPMLVSGLRQVMMYRDLVRWSRAGPRR